MHLCQRKKSFIKSSALILYLKLPKSIFHRFVILKRRVLGGWVWNVASFWHKLWEDSICEWPLLHRHCQSWNVSCLKTWVLRHYKVALLLITQGDIQSIEQKILSKSLNQIDLYKTLIKRWAFDDSHDFDIKFPLLNCLNILK